MYVSSTLYLKISHDLCQRGYTLKSWLKFDFRKFFDPKNMMQQQQCFVFLRHINKKTEGTRKSKQKPHLVYSPRIWMEKSTLLRFWSRLLILSLIFFFAIWRNFFVNKIKLPTFLSTKISLIEICNKLHQVYFSKVGIGTFTMLKD